MANTFKFGNGNWAVKDGYALAYNDENGNFKPLPFDFTRASTATRVNKDGLIENVPIGKPRIDFTDNTSGHLLLEPSRTNIITNSEQFVDAPTGNTNMDLFSGTITNNNTTSPDGNTKGMKYTISSGSVAKLRIYQSDLSTSADTTFSIYAKSGTANSLSIAISGGTTKSVTTTNEWQRITTTDTSDSSKFIDVDVSGSVGEYIYIFGMQAEAGSYATSYIPTEGSSVTRSAEVANGAGNSTVFNDSEGVLYAEIAALANDGTSRRISISAGNTNNNNLVSLIYGTSNKISPSIYSGGGFQMGGDFTLSDQTDTIKVALKYSLNDAALWVNGVEVLTDNSVTPPVGLDQIKFEYGNGSNDFYGKCKDLRVYDTALSDSELQALTS